MGNREILTRLWAQPDFQALLKAELLPGCPEVVGYTPDRGERDWVYSSGLRDGYLLALKNLGVEID